MQKVYEEMRIDLKERLDVLLVKKGLVNSRQQAKAVIMAGEVFVNGEREDKAGTTFDEKADIVVKSNKQKYVSRGGFKLEKAINNLDKLRGCEAHSSYIIEKSELNVMKNLGVNFTCEPKM